jgi:hypothetical protein
VKITPDDFIKMNEEFVSEGTPMVLIVPTQEQIDNPTGVKLPTKFEPQPPMNFDDPWPHTNSSTKKPAGSQSLMARLSSWLRLKKHV